jgi:hypothetical protein
MNQQAAQMFGTAINFATARDLYPDAPGSSTAQLGSAATPYTTDTSSAGGGGGSAVMQPAGAGGGASAPVATSIGGKPLSWFVVLLVLFLALGYVGHKIGGREGETGVHNLKLSGYNILFITLAAMLGFAAFKVIFSKLQVPGLSTFVQSV